MAAARTVLITGASGFLAAWIIPQLLARGHAVVATDLTRDTRRLDRVDPAGDRRALRWSECNIGDAAAVAELAAATNPQIILHLAAMQIPACKANPAQGACVNISGHIHMLDAARAHGARLVYTSSVAAKPRGPANAPANLYGVYKKTCEEIARLYAEDFGVPSIGLRPHVVYGIGRDQGETSAVTAAMQAAARGEAFTIPWTTRTCFQFAGDIAAMFVAACEASSGSAVVADMTDRVESTDDIVAAIRAAVPDARVSCEGPERISPVTGFDVAALETVIGPRPDTSLQDGVARTIAAFKRAPD